MKTTEYGKEDTSKTDNVRRVHCSMTGGHEWVAIPLPMDKGPLEPTLEVHYSCTKCNTMKRYNLMDTELIDELDERQERLSLYYQGVEDG